MPIADPLLCLLVASLLGEAGQQPVVGDEPFPASTALAEGVSPAALARLDELVQGLVDDGEVVGAELLVIKNGSSILHAAHGWRDREAEVAMETGSVFCVRSMTKPVIGTAILMLLEEDRLDLGDRVADHLPAFDVEGSREITVEHLLTHTSGLPLSLIMGKDLRGLGSIRAVADLGGGYELGFEAGSGFQYSDQGTDTLTALIEVVAGMPAADFVRTRVLEPLGMEDSACVLTEGHALRARACSKYAGSSGNWTRFWSPAEPPLFPFFLGSQGLYTTLEDYARFMDLWRRGGRLGRERVLHPRYVRKALAPGPYPLGAPTGLPGLRAEYGFQMQLWTRPDDEQGRELVAFGHGGSDGTHAWVFPEQDAMVLYFTQSRNNPTGLRVEEVLGDLFLGVPFDPNLAAPPFEPYLGYYWEGEGDLYRAIVRDGENLALEIMGRGVVALVYVGEDRWKARENPSLVLAFERSEAGEVTGYRIGDHQEHRFEPSADLPRAEDLAQRVAEVHRIDLLESVGPIRMSSGLTIEGPDLSGQVSTLLAWPDRWRYESLVGEEFEHVACDGEQVRYASRLHPVGALDGARAESMRLDTPMVHFGDWRRWYPRLTVIQQLDMGGRSVYLVRAGDASAPAPTMYVDSETGRLARVDSLTHVETMGRVGQRQTFGDYRDVSGMLLPFRTEAEYPTPLIGTIVMTVEDVELGVETPAGTFELSD